ncbi:MAG: alpha/beta hydrolase [Pseudomonadota bacterium]
MSITTRTHTRWATRAMACLLALSVLPALSEVPRTVVEDPTLPQLALNGHRLHVEAFGNTDAPVVVVLHGGPGADYRYLLGLSALANQYRVVFYDQLGSGLSQRVPASQITVNSFVADLDAVIQHFSPKRPVHIVGHSWGAMLASAYAGAHPDKVDRMVLAEPGFLDTDTMAGLPSGGWPGWRVVTGFAKAWLGKWWVATDGDPYARDDWFLLQILPLTQGQDALCNGQLPPLQAWRFGSPAFEATLGRMMNEPEWGKTLNFAKNLEHYTGRVLFLRGACNQAQGESVQRRMMAKFSAASDAQLVTIAGAGHFMFNDQPTASVSVVRSFLTAQATGR